MQEKCWGFTEGKRFKKARRRIGGWVGLRNEVVAKEAGLTWGWWAWTWGKQREWLFAPGRLSCAGTENREVNSAGVRVRRLRPGSCIGKGTLWNPKYVHVVIGVFGVRFLHFSFTLDIPWEVYSWPRFSHCCLALRLPYSSFTVTGACGFGMIPFTSPGIVCQSLQKVIVCVLKYTACAFLHFFFSLKKVLHTYIQCVLIKHLLFPPFQFLPYFLAPLSPLNFICCFL